MKKIILAIAIVALAILPSFADEGVTTKDKSTTAKEEGTIVKKDYTLKDETGQAMTGTFKSIVPADLTRVKSALTITDENGSDVEFSVKSTTVIYDSADGKILSLSELVPGDKVQVSYQVPKEGGYLATAVKVLPKEEMPKKEEKPVAEEKAAAEEKSIK